MARSLGLINQQLCLGMFENKIPFIVCTLLMFRCIDIRIMVLDYYGIMV